jgi:hypothetical protein
MSAAPSNTRRRRCARSERASRTGLVIRGSERDTGGSDLASQLANPARTFLTEHLPRAADDLYELHGGSIIVQEVGSSRGARAEQNRRGVSRTAIRPVRSSNGHQTVNLRPLPAPLGRRVGSPPIRIPNEGGISWFGVGRSSADRCVVHRRQTRRVGLQVLVQEDFVCRPCPAGRLPLAKVPRFSVYPIHLAGNEKEESK